jgi:polyhydroxyalkanoate synthesis repressor PhaR
MWLNCSALCNPDRDTYPPPPHAALTKLPPKIRTNIWSDQFLTCYHSATQQAGQCITARTVKLSKSTPTGDRTDPVVIKKYANRRLYNTETSTYVTLEDLAQMVRADRDFVVRDAKSGDDLTHSVLTQIIVEQESRSGGPTMLPIPFLRQLIRYYDDSIGKLVPGYLQFSLEALTKEQERFRTQFVSNPWGTSAFEAYQDQARRNLAVFEKAMSMWSPFNPAVSGAGNTSEDAAGQPHPEKEPGKVDEAADTVPSSASSTPDEKAAPRSEPTAQNTEIDLLKAELAAMQKRIENLSRSDK